MGDHLGARAVGDFSGVSPHRRQSAIAGSRDHHPAIGTAQRAWSDTLANVPGHPTQSDHRRLLRRGRLLETATLGWNVVGVFVLVVAAFEARSVALAGFGLDSLIEIGASMVVLWELADVPREHRRRAMRLIGFAFVGLAVYLAIQSTVVLVLGFHPRHSPLGILWTGLTAVVMFTLAAGKAKTGNRAGKPGVRGRRPNHHDRRDLGDRGPRGFAAQRRSGLVVGRSLGRIRASLLRRSRGSGGARPLTDRV